MDQKEIDERVNFIDTLVVNVDNQELSDEEFREFVRKSTVTRFNPHMSVMRIKVEQIGDCIRHCGDYGRIYFNHLQLTGNGMQIGDGNGSAFVMLGDSDGYGEYGGTTIKEIKKAFELIGIEVEIGNEYEPMGEGWEEVSRGIEISNSVTLDHEPEVGELVRGDFISVKELELIEKHPDCNKQIEGFNPMTGLWIAKYIDFGTGNPHTIFVTREELK